MCAGTCIQIKVHFMTSFELPVNNGRVPGGYFVCHRVKEHISISEKTDLQKPTMKHHTKGGVHIQVN